jgi:hypothetical protein
MDDDLELSPAERDEIPAGAVGPTLAPRLRPGVGSAFLDDEAVLLDPATGASHLLDRTAALVTRLLDGESTLGEIAFDIADVLGVERERVEADVVGLVRALGEQGLLEGVARDPRAGHARQRRPAGVPVGADLSGWEGWGALPPGPTLIVHWGTRCGHCSGIVAELGELAPRLRRAGTHLVLVTTGDEASLVAQTGGVALPVKHVDETPDFFAGLGTPVAYVVGAGREVTEPIAIGSGEVPDLARRLTGGA